MGARLGSILGFILLGIFIVFALSTNTSPPVNHSPNLAKNFGKLPVRFEQNKGQFQPDVHFISRSFRSSSLITDYGLLLSNKKIAHIPIEIQFHGANRLDSIGEDLLAGTANYFIGNDSGKWIRNVPMYKQVVAEEVYSGIDVRFHSRGSLLEYDFIVHPSASLDDIRLQVNHADSVTLNESGSLVVQSNDEILFQHKPYIYQDIGEERIEVQGNYKLLAENMVTFEISEFNSEYPLIIDPVLEFSTHLGGEDQELISDIALDSAGNIYVTGTTNSTFYPTVNPVQANYGGGPLDAFVTKLSPDGTSILYSTYIGGSGREGAGTQSVEGASHAVGIAVNDQGEAFIAGFTDSDIDFPIVNAFQPTYGGGSKDGYIAKLNNTGNALSFSTYVGGEGSDYLTDVEVDSTGNAIAAGFSNLPQNGNPEYPTTVGVVQPNRDTTYFANDGVITKLDTNGAMVFSTFLGGETDDLLYNIELDSSDNIFVTGYTDSQSNLPIVNAPQTSVSGGWFNYDIYIAKLNSTASAVNFGTYWGGTSKEYGRGITVDSNGKIIVIGDTESVNFPTQSPYQATAGGNGDAVIVKMSDAGVVDFSSYLGDVEIEYGWDVEIDSQNKIYISGTTHSPNFSEVSPLTEFNTTGSGGGTNGAEAFISQFSEDGSSLIFSSKIGGDREDHGFALEVTSNGDMYLAGRTDSDDFHTTSGIVQPTINYWRDGFVVKLQGDGVVATPPDISITSPADQSILNIDTPIIGLSFTDNGGGIDVNSIEVQVDSILIATACNGSVTSATCVPDNPMSNGTVNVSATVADTSGLRSATDSISITIDTVFPGPIDLDNTDIGGVVDGQVTITGDAGSVEGNALVVITNTTTGSIQTVTANGDGSFSATIAASLEDKITITVQDAAGNQSTAEEFTVTPPDPVSVSPTIEITGEASFTSGIEFLYTGTNPIQIGVAAGTIEVERASVIRGKVLDRNNQPLHGAKVTIHTHGEYGHTFSRQNGEFDLAVNGGGVLTVEYTKDGYLPVQRTLDTDWKEFNIVKDVVMIPVDPVVTTVDLTSASMQVAQGSMSNDLDGDRQATVMFPQGTTATMIMSDGSSQSVSTINVRATEYTIGENGPETMPGDLPATSAYTYAVDLNLDEAISSGAISVEFNQTLPFYVDNFLEFPTGSIVPVGYYSFEDAEWVSSTNGRVIEVLSINVQGEAELDIDGTAVVASQTELDDLGISSEELVQLATLYNPGKTLWRTPITHFTPWDCNWPWERPADTEEPPENPPTGGTDEEETPDSGQDEKNSPDQADNDSGGGGDSDADENSDKEKDPCKGCIIEAQNQVLGEEIPIVGTPYSLNYRSDRAGGDTSKYTLEIPLSGDTVPANVEEIRLEVVVAGKAFRQAFVPAPNLSTTFVWDGLDAYGRKIKAARKAIVRVSYNYGLIYFDARGDTTEAWAQLSPAAQLNVRRNSSVFQTGREYHVNLQHFEAADLAFSVGGWTLSPVHFFSFTSKAMYLGNGNTLYARNRNQFVINTIAEGSNVNNGDGGLIEDAEFESLGESAEIGPDGSLYFSDGRLVRRVGPDGVINTVAGCSSTSPCGGSEGSPATEVEISIPRDIAVLEDGSFFIASSNNKIYKVDSAGILTTLAGTGSGLPSGDNGPAVNASIGSPRGIAVDKDGTLYFSEWIQNKIRKIDPKGIITTVAGTGGGSGQIGINGPAASMRLSRPAGIAIDDDGNVIFAETLAHRIRKIRTDGFLVTIGGDGNPGSEGDGNSAIISRVNSPNDVKIAKDGSIYVSSSVDCRIRRITPDTIINTIVGTGVCGFSGDQNYALRAEIGSIFGFIVDFDGSIYLPENTRLRKVNNLYPKNDSNEILIPDPNGVDGYIFDENGVHLRTIDLINNFNKFQFTYSAEGRLTNITDVNNNVTTIEYTGSNPSAIVSPKGQRTEVSLDSNGYLSSIILPSLDSYVITNDNNGLIINITNPRNHSNALSYDVLGRLSSDVDPVGGGWTLTRTELPDERDGYTVNMTTGENRTSSFQVEVLNTGREHTSTAPNGGVITKLFGDDGINITTYPDGTTVTKTYGQDPRFGILTPILEERVITTPSGLTNTRTISRTVTLSDPEDILSLTSYSDITSSGGENSAVIYDSVTRTWTVTGGTNGFYTRTFDAQGRVISEDRGGDIETVNTSYNVDGTINSISTGSGSNERTTQFAYYTSGAQNGFLESITNAEGQISSYEYDANGNVTKEILPDLREVNYLYDENGNLTTLTTPRGDSHSFAYTELDLDATYTPPIVSGIANVATQKVYNKERELELVTRPDGQTIDYVYNATTGNLDTIAIPRGSYSFNYDSVSGKVINITSPDNVSTSYSYDGFLKTNETWSGEIAGSVDTTYNNRFKVLTRSINGANQVTHSYNDDKALVGVGLLAINRSFASNRIVSTTISGPNQGDTFVDTSRAYNEFGELTNYTVTTPDLSVPIPQLLFDLAGEIDSIYSIHGNGEPQSNLLEPLLNLFIESLHADIGDISGVVPLLPASISGLRSDLNFMLREVAPLLDCTNSQWDETDCLEFINLSNQMFSELDTYEASLSGPGNLYFADYVRDKLGRVTEINESINGATNPSKIYTYDVTGRLTNVTVGGIITTYTYDSNGNRTHVDGILLGTYDEQDRLLSYGDNVYTYSDNGELQTKTNSSTTETTTYSYDVFNNLISVNLPNGSSIEYLVDGKNRRVGKKVDGTLVNQYLYIGTLHPIAELDGLGNLITRFVYGDKLNVPSYMIKNGVTYRIISDQLGSPRVVVNLEDGTVVQQISYNDWGNVISDTNPGFQPFGYAGGLYDPDTGLVSLGVRDYDPEIGRWTTKDVTGFDIDGFNLYIYSKNDPINYFDPIGMFRFALGGRVNVFAGGVGASFGINGGFDTSGNICGTITSCARVGVGASVGVAGTVTVGSDYDPCNGGSPGAQAGAGVFGNAGVGLFGSVTTNTTSSGATTATGSVGAGAAGSTGGQVCLTRNYCF